MVESEDWLFRPVMRNMIRAESLLDGTIDLAYIALLNEAIDVENENQRREHRYQAAQRQ
jgi:hypothetical protein